ncbi:MAG: hypothetical protein Q8P25_03825 [Candidatus Curtissbacteria bacterium]|nr:hypothetical protein [Candidatus Curtissbacteria bacterium]
MGLDRKDNVLGDEGPESTSSDSYVTGRFVDAKNGVYGTTGNVIDISLIDVYKPKSIIGKAESALADDSNPAAIMPVNLNDFKINPSGIAQRLVEQRRNRKAA